MAVYAYMLTCYIGFSDLRMILMHVQKNAAVCFHCIINSMHV